MGSSPKPGADRLSVPPEAVGAFSSVAAFVLRRLTDPSLSALALALAACGGDAPFGFVGEEFRRIQRGSSLPFGSAAVRLRARLAIKLETIYFANNLHLTHQTQLVRCQYVAKS